MMKSSTFLLIALCLLPAGTWAQQAVSIMPGYTHRAYYSLDNGLVQQSPDGEWDLAFQLTGFAAGIRVHHPKGVEVRKVPALGIADWGLVDTAGMATWPQVYNDPKRWDLGALNQGLNPANPFDLGWGIYSMITHHVNGDSLFVITLADGNVRKLKIDRLASGVFTFTHARPDGSDEVTVQLRKADFPNRHFAYYSFATDSLLDLDPPADSWDLVFSRYQAQLAPGVYYPVTGVRTNFGLRTAELRGVDIATVTEADTALYPLSADIDVIGYDWKDINMTTFQWDIEDSLAYLVRQADGEVHKLVFTGFGGSSNGDFLFTQETLTTSLDAGRDPVGHLTVFPNPAHASVQVQWDFLRAERVELWDLMGRRLWSEDLAPGQASAQVDVGSRPRGTYLLRVISAQGQAVSRVEVR